MSKEYVCECAKIFTSPNSFNGHKSNCKIHQLIKYGSLELLEIHNNSFQVGATKIKNIQSEKAKKKNQLKLDKWISEQHACEKCGKIMAEKYGSGRFCSRACANSHVRTEESREKTSNSLKLNNQVSGIKVKAILKYNSNPNLCKACGAIIPYEQKRRKYCNECSIPRSVPNDSQKVQLKGKKSYRVYSKICPECNNEFQAPKYRKYCSNECFRASMSKQRTEKFKNGELIYSNLRHKYKYGTYKNISCDSSWELAYVIYLIDHNISFERNRTNYFEYEFEGTTHLFFPDFIVEDTFIEIKNYKSELTESKLKAIPKNIKFKILYKKEIQPYLKYARDTYGKDFYRMYDRNYPSWMDKLNGSDISTSN